MAGANGLRGFGMAKNSRSPQPILPKSVEADPLLLRAGQMAARLQCSERHLGNLTAAGLVRCIRKGRSVRYDPAQVLRDLGA